MGFLKTFKQSTFVHLCFAISYFTSGLVINIFQAILYVFVRPFSKSLYRKLNYYLMYSFSAQLVFMAEWWSGIKLSIYIDKEDFQKYLGKEHAYIIANHSYEIDWLMGWLVAEKIGCLGNCKAFAKKAIQYVPPIGWMWKFCEFIFLERNYEKDKEIIKNQIAELCDYPDPIWILNFPEGTRFTATKHEASVKFATEKKMPILKHHLCPRTRGFNMSVMHMRGKVPAVYDNQIAFTKDDEVRPTMTSLLYGKQVHGHFYINRIPTENIPEDETEASQWLQNIFVRKDKMMESFNKHGDFFTGNDIPRIEPFEIPRSIAPLLNTLFWAIAVLIPMFYYLLKFLFNGELVYFSLFSLIFGSFHILLKKTIGMSQISHGSSYGAEKKK